MIDHSWIVYLSSFYLVKTNSCMPLPLLLISNPCSKLCYASSANTRPAPSSHSGRDHQKCIAFGGAVIPRRQKCGFHGFIASLLQGSEEQWTCSHIRTYGIDRSFYLVHDDTPLPHRECLYFTANALYQHSLLSPADLKRTHPTHSLPLILH